MKKQVRLFTILLILVFSMFSFAAKMRFSTARATYVEGVIMQDTTWTLVDSPYVVSNDILVLPNVTLTIEPNVEVRFGGSFNLTVEGILVANGTKDKMITFTSNKHIPAPADWSAIRFQGVQPSTVRNCIVEYGIDGTVVEGGSLNIQDSLIRFNSMNGIRIADGHIEAKNNIIANNTLSGVYVFGDSQAIIQNNTIKGNGNGIILTGTLTSEISIERNNIFSNNQAGIVLEATIYVATSILTNTLSVNHYGFYVATQMSTYITRNYILDNTVGIYYQNGRGHQAHFNDIYDNGLGMVVASGASVNATYNYWGDKYGPNHISLNPYGRGNPVSGDGENLDFIFFLTASIDYNNARPVARLWSDKMLVAPNQTVTLVGTDSYDDGRIDQYSFNFGDGNTIDWTPLSLFDHNYSSIGNYDVRMKVIDDFGVQSYNALTTISVQNLTPLITSVSLSQQTVYYNENVSIAILASNAIGAVSNATVTLLPIGGGSPIPQSGLTNSTGYFTATFTAPNVTEITSVRIIARASKAGYADGSDFKYLRVLPPLTVEILPKPETLESAQTAVVTVHVTSGLEPIADASVMLASDSGNLSVTIGVTDRNGNMTAIFTAPQTMSRINVTIGAIATKTGFAVGFGVKTMAVEPRTLVVQVTANPSGIVSEAMSSVTAHITSNGAPISSATVTVSSSAGGNFSTMIGYTDSYGNITFLFTAPQATTQLNATITALATRSGYIGGEGRAVISVEPKVLDIKATARPTITISESRANITVYVTYGLSSISNANVTIASNNGGDFSRMWVLSDSDGYATFVFTTPPVNAPLNISITARASKGGYIDGENRLNITVNPGTLSLKIEATPDTITSGETTVVNVHVTSNATHVANASVTAVASDGNFAVSNAMTDANGYCAFVFNSPGTTTQMSITITANATKNGYIGAANHTTITVNPESSAVGGGWSLLTVLLIVIPIVIVVVVIVLIKLKIVGFSFEEDEAE